jgi:REP element-mobilizing transposase RayT
MATQLDRISELSAKNLWLKFMNLNVRSRVRELRTHGSARGGRREGSVYSTQKKYWGQHLWARGYFCATVGSVTEETQYRGTLRIRI